MRRAGEQFIHLQPFGLAGIKLQGGDIIHGHRRQICGHRAGGAHTIAADIYEKRIIQPADFTYHDTPKIALDRDGERFVLLIHHHGRLHRHPIMGQQGANAAGELLDFQGLGIRGQVESIAAGQGNDAATLHQELIDGQPFRIGHALRCHNQQDIDIGRYPAAAQIDLLQIIIFLQYLAEKSVMLFRLLLVHGHLRRNLLLRSPEADGFQET